MSKGLPVQLVGAGPFGIILYLTTPGEVPVLISVCPIFVPQPDEQSPKPVMVPPVGGVVINAVHV
ncbi:MAG: hypothetical protein IPH69_02560 [Bacteroidales bacterium]|nr:hypothetical protein [Bacteroidales bacterium]